MAVAIFRTQETRKDALIRLANKAHAEGVKLYRDPKDGRYVYDWQTCSACNGRGYFAERSAA
jgi:hypothetical protein